MGLDVSHDAFSAPYSAFMRFRLQIAKAANITLPVMEGWWAPTIKVGGRVVMSQGEELPGGRVEIEFFGLPVTDFLPLSWSSLADQRLEPLLNHSDCDGEIECAKLPALADALEEVATRINDSVPGPRELSMSEACLKFARGCRAAAEAGENLEFH